MKWIGITGGIGTGKSTVSGLLSDLGYPVIDADKVAHKALVQGSPVFQDLISLFGNDIKNSLGNIDRGKLAHIVFSDPHKLKELEKVVHPFVQNEVQKQRMELEKKGGKWAFYDVPLLYEKNLDAQFDAIILVACDPDIQIQRLMEKRKWTREEVIKRLSTQIPISEKVNKTKFVIWNNTTLDDLKKSVRNIIALLPRP